MRRPARSSHPSRRRLGALGACLVAGLILVGCGASGGTSRSAGTSSNGKPTTTGAAGASGPSTSQRRAPTTQTASATTFDANPVPADCDARSGTIDLPGGPALVRSPATDHRRPAVVMLHGYTATTDGEETVSGWTSFLSGTDVALIYPEGNPTPQGGYGWTTGTDEYSTSGTDDIGVVAQMVSWLVDQNCADPNQVLIAGESNGSALGLLVACSGRLPVMPRLYALAIPAIDENVTAKCAGSEPVPLVVFASRFDDTVAYNGTPDNPDGPTAPKVWFTSLIPRLQKCATSKPSTSPVPDGTLLTYSGCKRTTAFFTVADGHHTWPGGPTGAGGLDPGNFPASEVAWCASGLEATPPPVHDCRDILTSYLFPSATSSH